MPPPPLDLARCAVVVVDFQNDYCHPDGAVAKMGNDVSAAGPAADAAVQILDFARKCGVPCILVRTTHGPWTNTPGWVARGDVGDLLDVATHPICAVDSWGAEFFRIEPGPDDLVVTKHRYSAFGHTPLELALHAKQRDTILFAGTMTNACVEATAVDAVMRGFRCVLIREATATSTPEIQAAAEAKFANLIGRVIGVDELIHGTEPHPSAQPSPAAP